MSRRASLPGADELFRRTTEAEKAPQERESAPQERQVDKSPSLQVAPQRAQREDDQAPKKGPKHDEKVTFYCTGDDLMAIEKARLELRANHGIGVDRGKIVRAALAYVLEDFEARSEDSILLRRLSR